ncbi:hypothetical protein BOX15_Mlig018743g4 [Macrostomum lignano]|uniref:LysM domain-containing protein n=1 Tax=Macrostomum lignano TaxID=282301 RepID=A0A267ER60_9PLAT|nr:hypothetical protein BOX15_Mlig018743g4 [Macrostomum lignano]
MSFWPFSTLNGYTRAQTVSSSPDNSTVFYFGPKNPNRKKKRKSKNSPDHSAYPQNNQDNATSSRYEHELLIVKKQDRFEYYRVPLLKNENLHTVAMKYGCSVWELKRANHLWGLQDVHALPSLVIPAPKNSYRAELLAKSGGRLVGENQQSLQAGGSRDPDGADEDLQDTSGDLASGVLEVGSASAGATGSDDQRRPVKILWRFCHADRFIRFPKKLWEIFSQVCGFQCILGVFVKFEDFCEV